VSSSSNSRRGNRLKHFVKDGIWASVCEGFAESNFNAFATALSASPHHLSILTSSQSFAGCWLQLWSEKLVGIVGSRKKLVLICVSLQIIFLGGMAIVALGGFSSWIFMALTLLFTAVAGLSGPVWSSWVSHLLPSKRRGLYFGIRSQRTYPAQFASLLLGGLILQNVEASWAGTRGIQLAFVVVFLLGLVAKLLSLRNLFLQPERPFVLPKKTVGPIELVINFFAVMGLAINVSAPFQTPYLLKTLHFSYFQFSLITAFYIGARCFGAPLIGRLIDTWGSRHLLLVSTLLMPCIPLGWSLSTGLPGLLAIQFAGGIIWTVFDLCTFSFLTETSTEENRQRIFALKHVAWSLGSSSGAILGGVLANFAGNLAIVFWGSTLARAIASIFVLSLVGAKLRTRFVELLKS
jgi:MFS family permease